MKAHDIILGLHKEIQPRQPWIIHGFRAKPGVAKMLTDKGIYLSFGEKFNTDSIRVTPPELICAETDESTLPIETIISSLSAASPQPLLPIITDNHARLFIKR